MGPSGYRRREVNAVLNAPHGRADGARPPRLDSKPGAPNSSRRGSWASAPIRIYGPKEALTRSAGSFLADEVLAGGAVLIVSTAAHAPILDAAVTAAGVDVTAARAEGRYVGLEADETLEAVLAGDRPDLRSFSERVEAPLRRLAEEWPRVAVYQETTTILHQRRDPRAAALDRLWGDLVAEGPPTDQAHLPLPALGGRDDNETAPDLVRAERDRALLAAIVTSSDDAIVSKDVEGRITSWNAGAERLFGYTAAEAIGQPIGILLPDDRRDEGPEILERIRRGERVETYETVRRHKDGEDIEITLTVSPVKDAEGRVVGASKIARGFTEQRKAERRLREAEAYYHRLVEMLPIGIFTCDTQGVLTYYNQRAARIWGRTPEIGERCRSPALGCPAPSGDLRAESATIDVALEERRSFRNEEILIERPDGSHSTVLVDIEPIADEHGQLLGTVVALHDVTDAKRAERELREQREQLETLLETVPLPVFLTHDPDARFVTGNRAATELFRADLEANLSLVPEAGEPPATFRAFRNGEPIPPEDLPLNRAARGIPVTADQVDFILEDGSMLRALVSARALVGMNGEPRGAVAALVDVTELKASADALREADRLKTEFLATLSHELRNPLAPILTGLEVMRLAGDRETLERTRATVERQSMQLVRIVDDLLDIARITRGRLELRRREITLADVVDQAADAMTPAMKQHGHTFVVEPPEPHLRVLGDPERLVQVLGNLLHNAAIYTPANGRVTLRAEATNSEVALVVEDTGVGIPSDMRERVFEMFTHVDRAHESGHSGLGVGLTLARSLVELHGGSLEVESAGLDLGSTFTVRLPLLEPAEHPAPMVDMPDPTASAGPPRRVLIVDDNEAFVESLSVLIETLGHDVRTAADGAAALQVGSEQKPDIVLMDLGMPGMNGYDAARRMREEPWGRDVMLVALTGWGRAEDKQRTREAGFDHHVVKPPQPAELRRLLSA